MRGEVEKYFPGSVGVRFQRASHVAHARCRSRPTEAVSDPAEPSSPTPLTVGGVSSPTTLPSRSTGVVPCTSKTSIAEIRKNSSPRANHPFPPLASVPPPCATTIRRGRGGHASQRGSRVGGSLVPLSGCGGLTRAYLAHRTVSGARRPPGRRRGGGGVEVTRFPVPVAILSPFSPGLEVLVDYFVRFRVGAGCILSQAGDATLREGGLL